MQAGDVAGQIVKSLSARAPCAVDIDAVEFFEDIEMIGHLEIGRHGLQKALALDILAVVFADGRIFGNDVGNVHHDGLEFFGDLFRFTFDRLKPLGVRIDFRLYLFGLFGLFFAHELSDLFGEGVAGSAELVSLRLKGAALAVELERAVYEGKFTVLKFLFDIFAHRFGVATKKSNIDHTIYLFLFPSHIIHHFRRDCNDFQGRKAAALFRYIFKRLD